ncbi:MAG: glycosyltransferase family 39 protein, partial [Cyanobacteria bacterium]|nr:glycosyltransferase family 39 protein [Cyanobacteriota bacterium]
MKSFYPPSLTLEVTRVNMNFSWISMVMALACQGILLILSNFKTSLMAHDEGWYTTLALGMVRSQDWLSPTWWGQLVYDKTSGLHWLIAASLNLFGSSETAARLPSGIACLISVGLMYWIGTYLLGDRAAILGCLCLSTIFAWTQYGQLATQDVPLISIELICIWALLQAEHLPQYRRVLGFLSGLCLGVGFLVKGFMVALPSLALLPYLIFEHRRHKHLFNPGLYLGILAGVIAVLYWFWQLWEAHGSLPFEQLFGVLALAASEDYHGVGPLYYLWSIPAAFLPWTPIALLGMIQIFRQHHIHRKWLLLGYPAGLLLMLQIFPTKTPYYPLQIYPFLGLYAGLALSNLVSLKHPARKQARRTLRVIEIAYGLVGLLLLIASVVLTVGMALNQNLGGLEEDPKLLIYLLIALAVGLSWMGGLWLGSKSSSRHQWLDWHQTRIGLASLLVGPWLAIAIAGTSGLIGDYNPDIKAFLQQPQITEISNQYAIDTVIKDVNRESHKMWILTSFYTRNWGEQFPDLQSLPPNHYGWISPEFSQEITSDSA